jgi:hypothetical protein
MIIGVSGVAGSGKDTFYSILCSKINFKQYSLADELKREVQSWCKEHYGIDSLNCSRREKEIIRPFLVFHGSQKRQESSGRYWIEKISNKILNDKKKNKIITDIRYDDFENDEVSWLRKELGGILVHVSQYEIKDVTSKREWPKVVKDKVFKEPANREEARNDPKIKGKADFRVCWPRKKNPEGLEKQLSSYVDEFISQANLY